MITYKIFLTILVSVVVTRVQCGTKVVAVVVSEEPTANVGSMRTARVMKIPSESKKLRTHADAPIKQMMIEYHRHFYASPVQPMIRRIQNGPPTGAQRVPSQRFAYEPKKSSQYSPAKGGKRSFYRPPYVGVQHPNSLSHISPQPYVENVKASPLFNGKAILRPVPEQQTTLQFSEIHQYPIPQSPYFEHYFSQRELLSHVITPTDAQTSQQPQHAHYSYTQHNLHKKPLSQTREMSSMYHQPAPRAQSYSVHEEPEITGHVQLTTYDQNYLDSSTETAVKGAHEYLNFMRTNEYFLPKRDPNYKKLDESKDFRQYRQQQQQLQTSKSLADSVVSVSHRKPTQVSQLFYQQDPSPSSTIVHGSYQAGSNVFVVNSDGNKTVKHIKSSVRPTQATFSQSTYTEERVNSLRSRTPEPVRFEFTERDAVPEAYTNGTISKLKFNAVDASSTQRVLATSTITSSASTHRYDGVKSIYEVDDDPEDGEDMQETSSDSYGPVPVRSLKESSSEQPTEQKDTEEYCERICANLQYDDEEIVCGSDGYMYTSEPQMECYASCLHIDVTIQGKGSCSAS